MNDGRPDERGFTTVQYVAIVGFSLVLLVLVANVLVDVYARGAIRDALDEGVRATAPPGALLEECEERAADVADSLLRGPIGDDVDIACQVRGDAVVARAHGSLPSWLPGLVPSWSIDLTASMRRER
jgi:hypothetical protein